MERINSDKFNNWIEKYYYIKYFTNIYSSSNYRKWDNYKGYKIEMQPEMMIGIMIKYIWENNDNRCFEDYENFYDGNFVSYYKYLKQIIEELDNEDKSNL